MYYKFNKNKQVTGQLLIILGCFGCTDKGVAKVHKWSTNRWTDKITHRVAMLLKKILKR